MNELDRIRDGLMFMLNHFEGQHELFPRTIMTANTGGQRIIGYKSNLDPREQIIDLYRQSNYLDCRINAFPYNTAFTRLDLEVKNRTSTSMFMIDLDARDFGNYYRLQKQLQKTLKKIALKLPGAQPSVLWTGNGYHIYQPLEGIVFEMHQEFYKFLPYVGNYDLTTEFLRFAERHFTNNKCDLNHLPSIKSCLMRIPGTRNSKNNEEVKVIHKWNGYKPSVKWLAEDYRLYLIQKRVHKIFEKNKMGNRNCLLYKKNQRHRTKINWIEKTLETPLDDYRKVTISLILVPYCIVVRNLDVLTTSNLIRNWLDGCRKLRSLDFSEYKHVNTSINSSVKNRFPPMKTQTMKINRLPMYDYFRRKSIIDT